MKKRIISALLALAICLGMLPALALAAWDGEGEGTERNPYRIATKEQLMASMAKYNEYYILDNDLTFTPEDFAEGGICYGKEFVIGEGSNFYARGTLRGNRHTIFGLQIPLVKNLNNDCMISSLNFADVRINEGAVLADSSSGTIKNCAITGTWYMERDGNEDRDYGGYLINSNDGTIINCRNEATTQITFHEPEKRSRVGVTYSGICRLSGGVISDCIYDGKIVCTRDEGMEAETSLSFAGIVKDNSGRVTGCENKASLSNFELGKTELSSAFGIAYENRGTLEACSNSGELVYINESDADTLHAHAAAAGIVGHNLTGTVKNCTNTGKVAYAGIVYTNGSSYMGGTIEGCRNEGTVIGSYVGGIVKEMSSHTDNTNSKITNCVNAGKIEASYAAGGIAAEINGPCEISGCTNLGEVSGSDVGGIVGYILNVGSYDKSITDQDALSVIIRQCLNAGTISAVVNGGGSVGGIVGGATSYQAPVRITDVYNVGEIRLEAAYRMGVGGVAGRLSNSSSSDTEQFDITLENSYSTGKITSSLKETGGVVGDLHAYLKDGKEPTKLVNNCYALNRGINAIGEIETDEEAGTQASAALLSAEEMGEQSSFTGFDFETVWSMSETLKRPYLKALGEDGADDWQDGGAPVGPGTAKIVSLLPKPGATDVGCTETNSPKFYITFDKRVLANRDDEPQFDFSKEPLRIYRKEDGKLLYTVKESSYDPGTSADTHVTDTHTMLAITPLNAHELFNPVTDYYITMGEGFVKFEDGSTSPAIAAGDWEFRTDKLPTDRQTIKFRFLCDNDAGVGESTFLYTPEFFAKPGSQFNLELAKASLGLAMAAFDQNGSQNIQALFTELQLGENYGGSTKYEYCEHTADSICYAIASAPLDIADKEGDSTLIAIAVCGAGYQSEWAGNFKVGEEDNHAGFQDASNEVFLGLLEFINKYKIKGRIKIWIAGYSRGAAVANLTAGRLSDGRLNEFPAAKDITFNAKDLYAYCFATPMGTVEKNPEQGYESIFNIINPIDPVPKVAPAGWGFGRYGRTYVLPSAETDRKFSNMLMKATKEYTKIMKGTTDSNLLAMRQIVGQGAIVDSFMDALSFALPRQVYSSQFQASVTSAIELYEKGQITQQDCVSALYYALRENPILWALIVKLLKQALGTKVAWCVIGEQGIEWALSELDLPGTTGIEVLGDLFDTIFFAHHPEAMLAWMQIVERSGKLYEKGTLYRKLYVNCPVTVSVYDGSGELLIELTDDETIRYQDCMLSAYIDGAGQKVVALPADGDYRIEVEATGDGTASYSVAECSVGTGELQRTVNYYDIPIKQGDKLTGQVPAEEEGQTAYTLSKGTEALTASEDYSGEQIVRHTVTCQTQEGGTVYGDGEFVHGVYTMMVAEADEDWKFAGWYQGQTLLSSECEYRFRVEADTDLTAKFVRTAFHEKIEICAADASSVQVRVENNAEAYLWAAVYVEGRLVKTAGQTLKANAGTVQLPLDTAGLPAGRVVKVFLTDPETSRPRAKSASWTIWA